MANPPYEVKEETYKNAHKPFDIVTDKNGNVGFIHSTSINDFKPDGQVGYAVTWVIGYGGKTAWFDHDELTSHGNMVMHILFHTVGEQHQRKYFLKLMNSGLKM